MKVFSAGDYYDLEAIFRGSIGMDMRKTELLFSKPHSVVEQSNGFHQNDVHHLSNYLVRSVFDLTMKGAGSWLISAIKPDGLGYCSTRETNCSRHRLKISRHESKGRIGSNLEIDNHCDE